MTDLTFETPVPTDGFDLFKPRLDIWLINENLYKVRVLGAERMRALGLLDPKYFDVWDAVRFQEVKHGRPMTTEQALFLEENNVRALRHCVPGLDLSPFDVVQQGALVLAIAAAVLEP